MTLLARIIRTLWTVRSEEMLQTRKLLGAMTAVFVIAMSASACSTSSNDSIQTGSIGYTAHSADFALRPACRDGFGNDRPCSY
ncbi:hypothetical protein ACVIKO_000908 [Rhizobium ruizarguesonis]|jgi:hypothetical protein